MVEMSSSVTRSANTPSRREFVQACGLSAAGFVLTPVLYRKGPMRLDAVFPGPASRTVRLDQDWLFGGEFDPAAVAPGFSDSQFSSITLPHCVTRLSWQNWEPASWEKKWIYRKHFPAPRPLGNQRVFLEFDGVMTGAAPILNGHPLPEHMGGYLPFREEITSLLQEQNVLAVMVDARWSNVPPEGSPVGPRRIDYLEPGGIYRSARLKAVPRIFISDVFAKPVRVLDPERRVDVLCSLNADHAPDNPLEIRAELKKGDQLIAYASQAVNLTRPGDTEVNLSLTRIGNVQLWHVDAPHLYDVFTTLLADGKPVHEHRVQIGFRDARWEVGGFFLNGKRLQIFGLNRHQFYPYVGGAMPARVQRRDAEILRREFNCNFVRCSHYPQAEEFLHACDELGLMVWEEPPGWGYLGDQVWQDRLVRDVRQMILRDRNHPSIVIWGVRANESANDVPLYRRTTDEAKKLDDSRPTSGSMTPGSRKDWKEHWHQDVFAYDDYHSAPDGTVGIEPPTEGVPYFLSEAVGQYSYREKNGFHNIYRRAGDAQLLKEQAIWHAQAHSRAAADPKICGVVAWCAFEYPSLVNDYKSVKYPGVADFFRIPKLGASFYRAQGDVNGGAVIEPNFYWDFGPETPSGPGRQAAIFSNCERLEVLVDGKHHATLAPDTKNYPHIKHAPFFVDLELDGRNRPELRIDGYVGDKLALSCLFASDPVHDRLFFKSDDPELMADGVDATRLVCKIVDRFGADRACGKGLVRFDLSGPGDILGDNPLDLTEVGGAAAIWVRSRNRMPGIIHIVATHPNLGSAHAQIHTLPEVGSLNLG